MGWSALQVRETDERTLQTVFDKWGRAARGCALAGVPAWLESLGVPKPRSRFDEAGYRFEPDVHWDGHVAELKCAAKFEPQALAEALHHAQCLSIREGRPYTPILITSYNTWLRRALEFLLTRGISPEHIRSLEVSHYEVPATHEHIMWFDAPFAAWKPDKPPSWVPTHESAHWYYVPETRTWQAVDAPSTKRPLIARGLGAAVVPLDGPGSRFVYWQGHYDRGHGICYLYDSGMSAQADGPQSIFAEHAQ